MAVNRSMAVVGFREIGSADIGLAGGKGANLGEMTRRGLPVPPGFCVTAGVYGRVLDEAGLWPELEALLGGVKPGDAVGLEAAAERIRALVAGAPMPADVAAAIREAYADLGASAVAVRSSATAEDLPEASFAGQQETYLGIRGAEDLLHHVRLCWASLWTARAISYRERNGFAHRQVSLAVVVQQMMEPDTAGVLFTINPLTGSRSEMLVNAAYGLGESVVSGRVTPDSYRLGRTEPLQVLERGLGAKEVRVRSLPGGGTVTEEVPPADRERFCLSEGHLSVLVKLGLTVERHYGAPQDIEWAIAGEQLYLLQTRPVTAAGAGTATAMNVQRPLTRMERTILDDILEHYPDPPYPLDHAAVVSSYEQLQAAVREVGLAAANAADVIRIDEDGIATIDPAAPRATWRLLGLAGAVRRKLAFDPGQWAAQTGPHFARRLADLRAVTPEALNSTELAGHIAAAVDLAADIGRVRFADYIAPMMLRGGLIRVLLRLGRGPKGAPEADLLGGLAYKTVEIDHALHRLAAAAMAGEAAYRQALDAFLEQYGARTMKVYLPFSNHSWREEPEALQATVAAIVRSGNVGGAEARARAAGERYTQLRDQVAARLPAPLRRLFLVQLERLRTGHVVREESLYLIEEAYAIARLGAQEAGRRLAAQGFLPAAADAVYLTLPELLAALRGEREAGETSRLVLRRRGARRRAAAAWRANQATSVNEVGPSGENALKGLAGSPGIATGPARVISGPAEFGKLQPGDVLVCTFTDPAWTPLFSLAAAVVSDTGGPLSHAAIVAREYGIPAVLGTGSATARLKDGDRLTVDGDRGTVSW